MSTFLDFSKEMYREEFTEFHKTAEELSFEVTNRTKPSDDEKRDEILRGLKDKYSIRQIERVTGISRGVTFKS